MDYEVCQYVSFRLTRGFVHQVRGRFAAENTNIVREPKLKTLFVGQQFLFVPVCDSTNTVAHAIVGNNDATPEGLTIVTDHQTAGRGQRGNQWQAPPAQNLLLSVLLRPVWLPVGEQFALSIAIALAGLDAVRAVLGAETAEAVRVKWPNDLYVGRCKVGGILIENTLRGAGLSVSVVGIGLNVNQLTFDPALPNPTSLSLAAGRPFGREAVLTTLLEALEARYLALRAGRGLSQRAEYVSRLYRLGEPTRFAFDGREAVGVIKEVDQRGRLVIDFGDGTQAFELQEVRLMG